MSSGERPIGAAKGKQPDTEALCHPPPPPPLVQAWACTDVSDTCLRLHLDYDSEQFSTDVIDSR